MPLANPRTKCEVRRYELLLGHAIGLQHTGQILPLLIRLATIRVTSHRHSSEFFNSGKPNKWGWRTKAVFVSPPNRRGMVYRVGNTMNPILSFEIGFYCVVGSVGTAGGLLPNVGMQCSGKGAAAAPNFPSVGILIQPIVIRQSRHMDTNG